jgi:hypothetical protein
VSSINAAMVVGRAPTSSAAEEDEESLLRSRGIPFKVSRSANSTPSRVLVLNTVQDREFAWRAPEQLE